MMMVMVIMAMMMMVAAALVPRGPAAFVIDDKTCQDALILVILMRTNIMIKIPQILLRKRKFKKS